MRASRKASSSSLIGLAFSGFVLIGAMGGSAGILLPGQIASYHVNTSLIGLLFLTFSAGYMLSAVSAGVFTQKFGQRWYLVGGSALCLASTLALSLRPPFLLFLGINLLLGFGAAVIDAGFNAAISELPGRTKLLNYLHAFYGTGALIGPLVASGFLAIHLEWNLVYLVWCGLSLLLLLGCFIFLRFPFSDFSASVTGEQTEREGEQHPTGNVVRATFRVGSVWLGALFLSLYVGAEISAGNWSYSFLLADRHLATLLAGWVVSGYWLGLTLGRFLINTIAERFHFGVAGMIYCCLAGIGMSGLFVWFLPGGLPAALGFCLMGFFLGPLYPTMIAVVPRLVPSRLIPSAIGLLIGISLIGGALFPWLVGALAQYTGLWVLLPAMFVLTLLMCANWWAITRWALHPFG